MKIGVDVDGTITSKPKELQELCEKLSSLGIEIYVITGAIGSGQKWELDRDKESRKRQLDTLGFTSYKEIHPAHGGNGEQVAYKKGLICKSLGIDLMIEDDRNYARGLVEVSPSTFCLFIN
jgi:hypothetical protein